VSQLPLIRTSADLPVNAPRWKSLIDPMLANFFSNGVQLNQVALTTTPTIIPHTLGQVPQGWIVSDLNADAVVFRTAPLTSSTITLQATASCVVNLWVY
jgi:hypothetical protein